MTDTRDTRSLPVTQSVGYGALWALGAIVLIATVYEVNKKVGLGLFVLALMGMALTYVRNNDIQFTRPL
jgi:hypothetical protein